MLSFLSCSFCLPLPVVTHTHIFIRAPHFLTPTFGLAFYILHSDPFHFVRSCSRYRHPWRLHPLSKGLHQQILMNTHPLTARTAPTLPCVMTPFPSLHAQRPEVRFI